jgi:thiamine-phosphate pyrophosphorylase
MPDGHRDEASDEDEGVGLDPDFAARFDRGKRPGCQLYLISPLDVSGAFPDALAAALDAGPVAAFQLRVKDIDQHEAARLAEPLQKLCAARDVAFIVNDSMALAKRIGADGVHLGQDDGDPREARLLLGPAAQIGVTARDSRHLAMEAGEAGADYVSLAPDLELVHWWAEMMLVPVVVELGEGLDLAADFIAAGAEFIALAEALWRDPAGAPTTARLVSTLLG